MPITEASQAAPVALAKRLDGRRIVVTGAGSGIGRAVAQLFASEGASLALLDRNADGLAQTAQETGGRPIEVDITQEKAVEDAIDEAGVALGGIDGVVERRRHHAGGPHR